MNGNSRGALWGLLFGISAAIIFGLFAFFTLGEAQNQVGWGWFLFSYAAGITMVVLPCTLPLAFVIVPLSMGKGPVRGLGIALCFGLGVAVTLSMYGVIAAIVGKVAISTLGAPLELVKNWLYFVAGILAYLFALGQLGLVSVTMPTYKGAFPGFIQKQQDYLKALLLGLFLGNIGIGCPHPATPFILGRIAVSGDIFYGWLLFFVHAIGRVLPLLFLAVLGILGVNALSVLVSKKDKIERATGWGMVFVAAFILVLGLFSHDWWVASGMHTYLEELTQEQRFLGVVADEIGGTVTHEHGMPPDTARGLFGLPIMWGTWTLLFLWIVPLWWNYFKKKASADALPEGDDEKRISDRVLPPLLWNGILLTLVLLLIFGYILPDRFQRSATIHDASSMHEDDGGTHNDQHAGHEAVYHLQQAGRALDPGLQVSLSVASATTIEAGRPVRLRFSVDEWPDFPQNPTEADDFSTVVGVPDSMLEILHEKKIHVISVRNDLTNFAHFHPTSTIKNIEEFPDDSARFEGRIEFATAGTYRIWSEVKFQGINHIFAHPPLEVAGTAPQTASVKNFDRSQIISDKYRIELHSNPLTTANGRFAFMITDLDGNAVELENYLGEAMHVAIISEDLKEFIHTHPEGIFEPEDFERLTEPVLGDDGHDHEHSFLAIPRAYAHGTEADLVGFKAEFARTGPYKIFAQFRPADAGLADDEYLLGEFWVDVAEQAPQVAASPISARQEWWRKLIVSLVFIAIGSYVVKRYLEVKEKNNE